MTSTSSPLTSASIVTLVTAPPCFGLPSMSLESTAVETIFKLGRIEHIVDRQQQYQQQRSSQAIPTSVRDAAIHAEASIYQHQRGSSSSFNDASSTSADILSSTSSSSASSNILLENADFVPTPVVFDANPNTNNRRSNQYPGISHHCWPPHLAAAHAATVTRLDESLNDEESATTQALISMIRSTLFPALELLWLADDGDFNTHVAPVWDRRRGGGGAAAGRVKKDGNDEAAAVEKKEDDSSLSLSGRAFWDRMLRPVSAMRQQRISRLKSIGRFATVDDAFTALEKSFAAIEKFLAASRRRSPSFNPVHEKNASDTSSTPVAATSTSASSTNGQQQQQPQQPHYFFGRHNQPSSLDGFVFAATSAIVFGQFTESSPLTAFQNQAIFFTTTTSSNKLSSKDFEGSNYNEHEQLTTAVRLPLCKKYAEDLASYFKRIASGTETTSLAKYFIDVSDLASRKERERIALIRKKERLAVEDPFAQGRQETLAFVSLTIIGYILLVNWKSIRPM